MNRMKRLPCPDTACKPVSAKTIGNARNSIMIVILQTDASNLTLSSTPDYNTIGSLMDFHTTLQHKFPINFQKHKLSIIRQVTVRPDIRRRIRTLCVHHRLCVAKLRTKQHTPPLHWSESRAKKTKRKRSAGR